MALDLLSQMVEPAVRVAKRGRSGYGRAEESLFLPLFSASPAASSVRLESQGGQSAGARGQCRGEDRHCPPQSDLQPTHPLSGLWLPDSAGIPWGWLGTQALTQLLGPGRGLRASGWRWQVGTSVGLETQRSCQPLPGPGFPMPTWSMAGFPWPRGERTE